MGQIDVRKDDVDFGRHLQRPTSPSFFRLILCFFPVDARPLHRSPEPLPPMTSHSTPDRIPTGPRPPVPLPPWSNPPSTMVEPKVVLREHPPLLPEQVALRDLETLMGEESHGQGR